MAFKEYCSELETKIESSYTQGVTIDEAEKLAGEFLKAQMVISRELSKSDLDARMRKSGLKALKAGVYLAEVQKSDKKPSDVLLGAIVDSDEEVNKGQDELDTAEVTRDELQRYYDIFLNAHIYYRGIAKQNG